ncbi:MAG: deoxyribose-phosphate aldolase [Chloroflexi bacterium]|nr:MAG: deoxyribose-phosphate aldolase [Chloroflexota bacterium]
MIPILNVETLTLEQLAKTIDHSLLKPELTDDDVIAGCELARRYNVASVCVKPCHVPLAVRLLAGSDVKVGTVVGFPHGHSTTATKSFEAREAVANGAEELDMVINIGALRSGRDDFVRDDIRAVVDAAENKAIVKVILENHYLTDEEKVRACRLAEEAGAHYVKTSTGFAPTGAKIEDLKLMRASVGPHVGVKAAHGVRSLDAALEVIAVGVTRIGATQTERILEDFKKRLEARDGGSG